MAVIGSRVPFGLLVTCLGLHGTSALRASSPAKAASEKHLSVPFGDVAALGEPEPKVDSERNASISLTIGRGNGLATVEVRALQQQASVSNQGFAKRSGRTLEQIRWQSGQILAKSDDYVWPVSPNFGTTFTLDHGASELVFGDLKTAENSFFRPEFEEVVYRPRGSGWQPTAEEVLQQQLREEQQERNLKLGTWQQDGWFMRAQGSPVVAYEPRLRVMKDEPDPVGDFEKIFLERPSIMDIDVLFASPTAETQYVRYATGVNTDSTYRGGSGAIPNLEQCRASSGWWNRFQWLFGFYCGRTATEQCATSAECAALGGRWKERYCMGMDGVHRGACGCCKEIGQWPATGTGSRLPLEFHVQWLLPRVSRFQCAPVSPEVAKIGSNALFLTMGFDTEAASYNLDLDLSLIPVDADNRVIRDKLVYYGNKHPQSLRCGSTRYAMRAFFDDLTGDEPGDDELVKLDLECLNRDHQDIRAILVIVNVYSPSWVTWNQIDSAYVRLVAGGQETTRNGNFFVSGAEAVRSYVRLSGDDMKANPSLNQNGLLVGMLFRNPQDPEEWAFGGLLEGVPGRNAIQSAPSAEAFLGGLSWPTAELPNSPTETVQCVDETDLVHQTPGPPVGGPNGPW